VLFCTGTIYLLFTNNPYLYSHVELHSMLIAGEGYQRQTVPAHPEAPAKLGVATGLARYNFQRTAVDPIGAPRSRAYLEAAKHSVDLPEDVDASNIVSDSTGFVVTGHSARAVAIDLDGSIRWSYLFLKPPGERGIFPALLDETGAYLVHPEGEIVALDKKTGRLRWTLTLDQELGAAPFAWGKDLILPIKTSTGLQVVRIPRANGHVEGPPQKLDLKPNFTIAQAPAIDALIATVDNKVVALDPETWKAIWSQTLTEPARGPAVVVDAQIFLTTPGGKLVRLDGSKRGKLDWDLDLPKPAITPPAFLPIMNRLTFYDAGGQLVAVDAKVGRVLWRTPVENRNPANETWSARLKGQNIEEFKMDWLHKGWTVWAPCADKRVCIYTPNKGQLIDRLPLAGQPLALPIAGDKRWTFLTQAQPGKLVISKLVELGELKKSRASDETNARKTDEVR
jgi:outer membrane protein assembly factor BamB